MTRTLVFGGARSGKSAHAEQLADSSGKAVTYVATAQAGDGEMSARIAHHRQRRDPAWATLEEPLALGELIAQSTADQLILVDCLTLWLSNLVFSEGHVYPDIGTIDPPPRYRVERERLLNALDQVAADIVLVSNEVGMGIVPQGAVSRWFVDEAGRLNQAVAARCDNVIWVAAGLPLILKGR